MEVVKNLTPAQVQRTIGKVYELIDGPSTTWSDATDVVGLVAKSLGVVLPKDWNKEE